MIRDGALRLESQRLAKYAIQVPCTICGDENTHEAERCRRCLAPMALTHQARSRKAVPSIMAVVGSSGVGKTVYLGMLIDMLSRQPDRLQLSACGSFSINLQQATVSALARGEFPAKTPTAADRWNWVHCQVRAAGQKAPLELIIPDMAGEALHEEVDHPRAHELISPLLSKSAGLIVLIDAVKLQAGSLDPDYFAMKLLTYVAELGRQAKPSGVDRPLALIFTKADECEECFADPAGFAQSRAPGVWRMCQERFRNFQYFAVGVAGGCAYRASRAGRVRVPLRVEPRGVVEPFEWLIARLKA